MYAVYHKLVTAFRCSLTPSYKLRPTSAGNLLMCFGGLTGKRGSLKKVSVKRFEEIMCDLVYIGWRIIVGQ
jgi:hypothetical protein